MQALPRVSYGPSLDTSQLNSHAVHLLPSWVTGAAYCKLMLSKCSASTASDDATCPRLSPDVTCSRAELSIASAQSMAAQPSKLRAFSLQGAMMRHAYLHSCGAGAALVTCKWRMKNRNSWTRISGIDLRPCRNERMGMVPLTRRASMRRDLTSAAPLDCRLSLGQRAANHYWKALQGNRAGQNGDSCTHSEVVAVQIYWGSCIATGCLYFVCGECGALWPKFVR